MVHLAAVWQGSDTALMIINTKHLDHVDFGEDCCALIGLAHLVRIIFTGLVTGSSLAVIVQAPHEITLTSRFLYLRSPRSPVRQPVLLLSLFLGMSCNHI